MAGWPVRIGNALFMQTGDWRTGKHASIMPVSFIDALEKARNRSERSYIRNWRSSIARRVERETLFGRSSLAAPCKDGLLLTRRLSCWSHTWTGASGTDYRALSDPNSYAYANRSLSPHKSATTATTPQKLRRVTTMNGQVVKSSARNRREKENNEFGELARLLPLPYAITCQLDKASVIRLTSSYLNLRRVFPNGFNMCQNGMTANDGPEIYEIASHLMQTLDGFVFVLAADGKIMYISETASVHLGLSQVELTGNYMYDYIHGQDQIELANILMGAGVKWDEAEAADEFEVERVFFLRMKCVLAKRNAGLTDSGYKVIHCSGYSRFHRPNGLETSTAARAAGGEGAMDCLGLIAVGYTLPPTAVTEIRLSAFVFMFRASLDLSLVFLDSRVSELIGFEAQQLLDKTLYELCHVCDMDAIRKAHGSLLLKHQVTTSYYRLLTAQGGWVWAQTQLTLVHIPRASRPNCIVGMTSVLSNTEHEGVVLHELQKSSSACSSSATAIRGTTDALGAYSESFYGPSGMLLVKHDSGVEIHKPEPAICQDPITGERRYRLRVADVADHRPSFHTPSAPCALQSAVYAAYGRSGV